MNMLSRWNPYREFDDLAEKMSHFWRNPLNREGRTETLAVAQWAPRVDITETPEEYLIKAELPEVKKDQIKLNVQNGVLVLHGERHQEKEEKGRRFHRVEREYGMFQRSFEVPEDADASHVKAEYRDGVLQVHLPKSERAKPQNIEINVS